MSLLVAVGKWVLYTVLVGAGVVFVHVGTAEDERLPLGHVLGLFICVYSIPLIVYFGPSPSIETGLSYSDPYSRLPYVVLGGISAGLLTMPFYEMLNRSPTNHVR